MSKGEILQNIGEGKYRVRQKLAVDRIQQELASLNERIAELAVLVPDQKSALLSAQDAVRSKASEIDSKIPDLQEGVEGTRQEIAELQVQMIRLQSEARKIQIRVSELIAENLAALKRRGQLEAVPEGREIEAWCADYSLELSGEIGLVDLNDEGGQGTIIQPGFNDAALYDPVRDGALFPNLAQTANQMFFNAAILPGVQKWMPRYRIGVISNIESDLCTVTLDAARSSVQSLNINEAEVLSDVPIMYMDCNAQVFEDDDRVVVRFTASGPLVVGFESNPKSCRMGGITFLPGLVSGSSVTTYGAPFQDSNGDLINPPLGSVGGANSRWSVKGNSSGLGFEATKSIDPAMAGNRNWIGKDDILSWHGPDSRVFDHDAEVFLGTTSPWQDNWQRSTVVFYKFAVLVNLSEQPVDGFEYVCGAAIRTVGDQKYLYVVCSNAIYSTNQDFRVYRWTVDLESLIIGLPVLQQTMDAPTNSHSVSDWYFTSDGGRAVCTFRNEKAEEAEPDSGSLVYRMRYTCSSNFVENDLLWDRYSEKALTGTNTRETSRTRRLVANSDGTCGAPLAAIYLIESDYSYTAGSGVEQKIPIYVECIGNEEVIVYYRIPGATFTSTTDYRYEEGELSRLNERVISSSDSQPSPRQIITSQGNVLAEEKFRQIDDDSYTFFERYQNDSWNYEIEYTESETYGGWLYNSLSTGNIIFEMVIDARIGFCSAIEAYYTRSVTASRSGRRTLDDEEYIGGELAIRATATNSGDARIHFLRTFLNGAVVDESEIKQENFPTESKVFRKNPYYRIVNTGLSVGCNDTATENTSSAFDQDANPLVIPISKESFLAGASVSLGGRNATSVVCRNDAGEVFRYQYLQGAPGNRPAGLFERPLGDPYVMHWLTVA